MFDIGTWKMRVLAIIRSEGKASWGSWMVAFACCYFYRESWHWFYSGLKLYHFQFLPFEQLFSKQAKTQVKSINWLSDVLFRVKPPSMFSNFGLSISAVTRIESNKLLAIKILLKVVLLILLKFHCSFWYFSFCSSWHIFII